MSDARTHDGVLETVSFLVVGELGGRALGIEIVYVDAVDSGATEGRQIEAADLGIADDASASRRVIRVRAGGRSGGIAVRGRLRIETVARNAIHALPPLVARTMRRRTFSAVALASDELAFLILDAAALWEVP